MIEWINARLDELPRAELRLGGWLVPVYLACGVAGLASGSLLVVVLSVAGGGDLPLDLAAIPVACAVFVGAALAGRTLRGSEGYVLLEHVLPVLGAWALFAWAAGAPILPLLDRLVCGLCVFLAWGRVGCLIGGCCYGPPARLGIAYPTECGHDPNVRRLPVQAMEIALWTGLAAVAAGLALGGAAGDALVTVLVGYGLARIFLEGIRGDPRPTVAGITESQVLGAAAMAIGIATWTAAHPPAPRAAAAEGVGLALAIGLIATRRWWLGAARTVPMELRQHLVEVGASIIKNPVSTEVTTREVHGLRIGWSAVSAGGTHGIALSLSRPGGKLSLAEAELLLLSVMAGMGIDVGQVTPVRSPQGVYHLEILGLGVVDVRKVS